MTDSTVGSAEQAVNVLSSVGEQRVVVGRGEPSERLRDGLAPPEASGELGHGSEALHQLVKAQVGQALFEEAEQCAAEGGCAWRPRRRRARPLHR